MAKFTGNPDNFVLTKEESFAIFHKLKMSHMASQVSLSAHQGLPDTQYGSGAFHRGALVPECIFSGAPGSDSPAPSAGESVKGLHIR
ncbi:MAG: hypothetical protein ACOY90_21545 [Candidatus Zhuqueibacterota bacterium]